MQEDERQRVRSYLVGQAEKKPFRELVQPVDDARTDLMVELYGVSEDQARFQPKGQGEDAWSIVEVLRHVIHNEESVALRIRALALGDPARELPLGRIVGHSKESYRGLVKSLETAREALYHAVSSVRDKERLDTTTAHPFFGELNCRAWFLFQRVHDIDHTRQIQKIKADAAYPKA